MVAPARAVLDRVDMHSYTNIYAAFTNPYITNRPATSPVSNGVQSTTLAQNADGQYDYQALCGATSGKLTDQPGIAFHAAHQDLHRNAYSKRLVHDASQAT
ncbi:MAG: hypothetical protein ABI165_02675 [Bryobacteraceae bacterium]